MVITGGSALSKDEIDRMQREAEQYAEEDHRRREEAEIRNQGEALVYQTEKFLRDNDDKVPGDIKTEVEAALADAKTALGGTDIEAIKDATEKLATTSQKLGTALYEQAQASQTSAGPADGPHDAPPNDDVVDAEIVDDGTN
jgi:molecular chaperone DnaK